MNLYENTVILLEAFEKTQNYIKKNASGIAQKAVTLPTAGAMVYHGSKLVAAKATAKSGKEALLAAGDSVGGVSGALLKARGHTIIPGSEHVTTAISSGISKAVNSASAGLGQLGIGSGGSIMNAGSLSFGISWLPLAAGLTAYGISKIVRYYKSLKYKELKLKKMQQLLPKILATKNINKINSFKQQIKNLQIDINSEKKVLHQQKQESQKEIQSVQTDMNRNKIKNPEKMKNINKSKQILSKIN